MSRLIDADALMAQFDVWDVNDEVWVESIRAEISHAPTVKKRKTGEWIRKISVVDCATFVGDECSQCGYFKSMGQANFCPNCGADMRERREEENERMDV